MKTLFMILACSLFVNTAYAQTPPIDDCPAGATLHRSLTGLDHASMLAAYTASFVGLYHRQPTMQPGSGSDDGEYWIATFNHYGPYGDGICRAGWNAYAELRLGGGESGDPRLGDQPAKFLPSAAPVPPPTVPPAPPATVDLAPLLSRLAALEQRASDDEARLAQLTNRVDVSEVVVNTAVSNFEQRIGVLEARPTVSGCEASAFGFPIHCALRK